MKWKSTTRVSPKNKNHLTHFAIRTPRAKNHSRSIEENRMKSIPRTLIPFFQEYDPREIDLETYQPVIIGRVLAFGTTKELQWLFKVYKKEKVKNFIKEHGYRNLSPETFNFWRGLLEIKKYKKLPWLKKKSSPWRF